MRHGCRSAARATLTAAACLATLAPTAGADTLLLTNGRAIEVDRAWYEGAQVRYEKDGGVYGLPRALVQRLAASPGPAAVEPPGLARARERLAAGDAAGAVALLRVVLERDPYSLVALQTMAEAALAAGDGLGAREAAGRAVRVDGRDARSRALLADALAALGDHAGADEEYQRSLLLRPDPEVMRRRQLLTPPSASPVPQFRLRYDGGVNEPLGVAVLAELSRAFQDYAQRLGASPQGPITVVLHLGQDGRGPEWAGGLNDGTIRVPVQGEQLTPALVETLRHELGHSFVAARTGGNCPTWLNEGVAQWLATGTSSREDRIAQAASRSGKLLPLLTLEAPFQRFSQAEVGLAYAESLSAVAHIVRRRGEKGLVRLLSALGDRLPSEEALPVALALSYPEFQRDWEQHLAAVEPATARSGT